MKFRFFQIILLFVAGGLSAQIENSSSLRIDSESDLSTDKYSISNSDTNTNSTLYDLPEGLKEYSRRNNKTFDMTGDNGFLKPESDITPKWFEKIEDDASKTTGDEYFGDFKSNGKFVHLVYRDHGEVDGDIVRVFINDDVIGARVLLSGGFKKTKINLIKGFNRIDVLALNEGAASPNTAEFHLYDDQGNLITLNAWNLATGKRATMIVIKD
ncbi:hypothetical protein [Aquimarina mytili]|uniref:Secreted protein n=1 Tax=Aquimarina mytili TaxID=874423 RepID=A0A936ZUW8_9FLAO|nr:hypothetical protein [Aquimarina mytili]MBL0685832.1 hypothetical protein [Aquimarina mytili]